MLYLSMFDQVFYFIFSEGSFYIWTLVHSRAFFYHLIESPAMCAFACCTWCKRATDATLARKRFGYHQRPPPKERNQTAEPGDAVL